MWYLKVSNTYIHTKIHNKFIKYYSLKIVYVNIINIIYQNFNRLNAIGATGDGVPRLKMYRGAMDNPGKIGAAFNLLTKFVPN